MRRSCSGSCPSCSRTLPEVGDPDKPKLVFFFDEAHLLFNDAPKALVDKVEQVARLIRSKGVGVYFITQKPGGCARRHPWPTRQPGATRACARLPPKDQKELKLAAETYRDNPRFSTEDAIREVGTGEAVTSFLEAKGMPGVVERTLIRPPASRPGPVDAGLRAQLIATSPLKGKYDALLDRNSAFEMLKARAETAAAEVAKAQGATDVGAELNEAFNNARRWDGGASAKPAPKPAAKPASRRGDSVTEAFAKSFARQLGSKSGQALVRGVLGSLFRAK